MATLILLSYAKFFNVIFCIIIFAVLATCLYGSRHIDVTRLPSIVKAVEEIKGVEYKAVGYVLLVILLLILLICVIFTALIFFWHVQWLRILRYQDKIIFKWVLRYQNLGHFLEPYHAPYIATGLTYCCLCMYFL